MKRFVLFAAAALVLGLAVSAHAFLGLFGGPQTVAAKDGAVRLTLADMADGKARFYSYDAGGKTVGFFVVKSPDGVAHARPSTPATCASPRRRATPRTGNSWSATTAASASTSPRVGEVKGGSTRARWPAAWTARTWSSRPRTWPPACTTSSPGPA